MKPYSFLSPLQNQDEYQYESYSVYEELPDGPSGSCEPRGDTETMVYDSLDEPSHLFQRGSPVGEVGNNEEESIWELRKTDTVPTSAPNFSEFSNIVYLEPRKIFNPEHRSDL